MIHLVLITLLWIVFEVNASNVVPDTMAERVKACTVCHGEAGRAGQHVYYPRIDGKPQGYLFNQLRNFRDGRRHYQPMTILLENMSDAYLMDIARYFSEQALPDYQPERHHMQSDEIILAERLVFSGDADRDIPACGDCHGSTLMGKAPFIPGLLGLPRAYLSAQFGSWRNGGLIRGQVSDCMSEIATKLTDAEINAVAKWLAAQTVSDKPGPADTLAPELAHRCSGVILAGPEQ
ncbi:Cytochrome c553 [Nitrosomonas sp. Nm51]|uniref:c-type cytochrome n=1 Tax=Nitrosomonas sp. Nm51 TaxID=133720 RepID=UPI0008C1E507|nr:cytochrome c4 [Nitrosomonas sp. Nm51]SER45483.1 Cytochrome c553 [Nitrosomonas sp. Nm51]